MLRLRAPLALVAVLLLIAMVAAVFVGGRLLQDWNALHNSTPAGATYQSQLEQLQAVALRIPVKPAHCSSGPYNSAGAFGTGPVYGFGGSTSNSNWGIYYHNLAYAETNVSGPILTRARDLITGQPVIFVGQYASGTVVGSDTVDGAVVEQHTELVFDASHASKTYGQHKLAWQFIAGVPNGWSGSTGWQIDGIGFSEMFLAC
jgi:hypothetical protein